MEKHSMLFLAATGREAMKTAITFLKGKEVTILAQYADLAIEILTTEKFFNSLQKSKLFTSIFDEQIDPKELKGKEAKEIAAAWNLNFKPATRSLKKADTNKGISWGDKNYDAPRHSEISEDFFLETIEANKIKIVKPITRGGKKKSLSEADFSQLEDAIFAKTKDLTKVYHLSRLAVLQPALKETILNLPEDAISQLFKANRSERSSIRGVAAEESCWKMNGEISVGVVFVESSRNGGPTFTATERTTLRNEIQTGINWLASQHPTGNLTWVFDYQYVSIDVANGTNSSKEDYWRNPAMGAVRYNGSSFSSNWNGVGDYRNAMRTRNESAHAIVIFVTPFGTEWHAYASSARLTLANRNNWGGWGINTIDAITAHEVCHLFGAADEYTGSGTPCTSCTTQHGCANIPNGNCKACAGTAAVPCIMDQNSLQICKYTKAQIGWPTLQSPKLLPKTQIGVVSRSANKLDIFVTDKYGSILTAAWEPAFTDWWHGWWTLNNGKAKAGAPVNAVSRSSNKLDAFVIGNDKNVYTAAWQPSFTDWWHGWWKLNNGIAALGAPVTAVSRSQDKLDVFVVGTDGYAYTAAWQPSFKDGWHGWWRIGNAKFPQGSAIHCVSRSADKLDIFATDVNGKILTAAWEPSFKDGWHGWWQIKGGQAAPGATVTAVSRSADKLDIFVVGLDGRVWTAAWQPTFTDWWHGWWPIGSAKFPQGAAIDCVSRSANKLDIFGTDNGGKILTAAWEPSFTDGWRGWWHIKGGMAAAGAPVTAVSRSTDKLDIFVTGLDGRAYTAAWEPAFTDWWHGWWPLGF